MSTHATPGHGAPPRSKLARWRPHLSVAMLATFLIGDLPTLYQLFASQRRDVPFWLVGESDQQLLIWRRNAGCLGHARPLKEDSTIAVIECPSGDVLVSFAAEPTPDSTWVTRPHHKTGVKPASAALGSAIAAPQVLAQAAAFEVLCQRFVEPNRVWRRIRRADGRCVDQTIDAYTGRVIAESSVACDASCDQRKS